MGNGRVLLHYGALFCFVTLLLVRVTFLRNPDIYHLYLLNSSIIMRFSFSIIVSTPLLLSFFYISSSPPTRRSTISPPSSLFINTLTPNHHLSPRSSQQSLTISHPFFFLFPFKQLPQLSHLSNPSILLFSFQSYIPSSPFSLAPLIAVQHSFHFEATFHRKKYIQLWWW